MLNIDQIKQLIRTNILSLTPYSTARDEYKGDLGIFLDANESPYQNGYNRYPDPRQEALKKRLIEIKGIEIDRIFLGNGSDEAIDLIFRIFCNPGRDEVVSISPSYGMYEVCSKINDVQLRFFELDEDFSFDPQQLLRFVSQNTKVIFLCSPNNPSGNTLGRDKIKAVIEGFKGIVVVDEAYVDFSDEPSLVDLISQYPNLIILQTLSKAYAMAGLRLGLALSNREIIQRMSMVKYPYNINSASQALVLDLLRDPIDEKVELIKKERQRVSAELLKLPFVIKIYPSQANFILVKFDQAQKYYDLLIQKGIIVRNRSHVKGCFNCLRITIGLKEENDALLAALREI